MLVSFCLRGFIAGRRAGLLGEEEEGLDFHNYRRQIRLTGAYRRPFAAVRLHQ